VDDASLGGEGKGVDCPVCREPLIVAEREGIELDVCPWCRGLWFDAGELGLLAEKLGRPLQVPEGVMEHAVTAEKPRPCPRCDRAMEKVYLGTSPRVLLDRCAGHGLWFDHGELGSLVRQLAVTPGSHPSAVLAFMGETFAAAEPEAPASGATEHGSGEVER
jgi:Zn-finger nucleic acid-binding protein